MNSFIKQRLMDVENNLWFPWRKGSIDMNWYIVTDIYTLLCIKWITSENLGEGNGTPLQYSCLENPTDGGVWWAAVHGVARVGHD